MNFENEINYAKHLENEDFSKDTGYFSKCVTLVRYWRTIGIDEITIFNKIYDILKLVYHDFGDTVIMVDIENILKVATAKGILHERIIKFSSKELELIHSFNQISFEKLLFILFCAYKLSESDKFVIKNREIMRLSNNSYSKKFCNLLLRKAYVSGLFDMLPLNNTLKYFPTQKTIDLFDENDVILEIKNFKNIIYYYLEYIEVGKFFRCNRCNCIERKNSNSQLYCSECAKIVKNTNSR